MRSLIQTPANSTKIVVSLLVQLTTQQASGFWHLHDGFFFQPQRLPHGRNDKNSDDHTLP